MRWKRGASVCRGYPPARAWVRCHPANPPPRTSTGPTSHTARARGPQLPRPKSCRPKSCRPLLPCRPCDWRRPLRLPRSALATYQRVRWIRGLRICGGIFRGDDDVAHSPRITVVGPRVPQTASSIKSPPSHPLPGLTFSLSCHATPTINHPITPSRHPRRFHPSHLRHPDTLHTAGRESPPWRLPRRRRPWTAARLAPTPAGASTCGMTSESWSRSPGADPDGRD